MSEPTSVFDNCPRVEESAGYLVFLRRWKGSKSERFFPCLVKADGQNLWLKHEEDSSYDHAHLRSFHLQHVRVNGHMNPDGYLIVEKVESAEDPYQTS
jgi:hypothetical protein